MRIGGVEVKGPNKEILVLPRMDEDIVIRAQAVTNMDEFEALVPEPKPPGVRTKDGWRPNKKDETYQQQVLHRGEQRFAYIVVKSLEPSEIEWEAVKMDDPGSWITWEDELRKAGLAEIELNRITLCVMQANSLDDSKLEAAREVFLHGQEEEEDASSGPNTEPENMPSGEPVSD